MAVQWRLWHYILTNAPPLMWKTFNAKILTHLWWKDATHPQWFVRKRHWFLLGQYYILFLKTLILTRKGLNLILSICSIFLILDILPLTYSCICLSYPSDPHMCTAKTADRKLITCLTARVVRIFSVISIFSPKTRKMLGKSPWMSSIYSRWHWRNKSLHTGKTKVNQNSPTS